MGCSNESAPCSQGFYSVVGYRKTRQNIIKIISEQLGGKVVVPINILKVGGV